MGGMGNGGACEPNVVSVYPPADVQSDGGPSTPPCMFAFPVSHGGAVRSDYEVNVQFSSADIEPFIIGHVVSESACGLYGWYFDAASPPSEILICPATCSMFRASNGAIVDLLFSCPTILAR